jgi:glycerol-3-phosphate dehydrogenase
VSSPKSSPLGQRAAALEALATQRFDVLVVGGGITGAGVAREAALRGLAVALVERDDFASGTSSRSSRLIHGGVRYLEYGHVHLVFESSAERRRLLAIAPHLVRPLEFTWPVYRGARLPRWKVSAALTLYDVLALFRNVGRHRELSARGVLAREPALRREGLVGGASYFDAATDDTRLTLANAIGAGEAGAVVVNHAPVVRLLADGGRVAGAVVRDALQGSEVPIAARVVVNATGPWGDALRRLDEPGTAPAVRGSKGAHVAVPAARVGNRGAVTLVSPFDGRVMFVLPAGAHTIVGTTETAADASPNDVRASEADVDYLLRSANAFFPGAHLAREDVVAAWAGLRPLAASHVRGDAGSASREHEIDESARGLVTVSGGKLTTYRVMAAEVVDVVARRLGRPARRAARRYAALPLPGGDIASLDEECAAAARAIGDAALASHLVHAYGTRWRDVWAATAADATLRDPVAPGLPYVRAELRYGVERELALTLADLLVRRTHVAFETRDNGRSVARAAAAVVAPLLEWDAARVEREIERYDADVERIFRIDA